MLDNELMNLARAGRAAQMARLPELITTVMPAWQSAEIADAQYLEGGYSNLNFAFRRQQQRYVIRLPVNRQPFVDRRHEFNWYQHLPGRLGVQPVALDVASGIMISPWVEGPLLVDAWHTLGLDDLAAYLADLHARLPDPQRRYEVPGICRALSATAGAPPPAPADSPREACHNDLNPWNIVIGERGWITLDWEFAGSNDPLFDLVNLHQGLALENRALPELADLYFAQRGRPRPAALQQRLQWAYQAFWQRELCWAEYQLARGNNRDEIQQQLLDARSALDSGNRLDGGI